MTREEEMWKAVTEEHGELSRSESFVALTAMEWADKTMLDRACEWLSIYYPNIDRMGIDEFINAFRQAMKGGAE